MKNEVHAPITFHYPVWTDAQYLITARAGAILCGLMALLLTGVFLLAAPSDADQRFALCAAIFIFIGLSILLKYVNKTLNGYIEISETQITRFFGDKSNISLELNDVELTQVKSISQRSKRFKLSSKSGKRPIVIGNDIENYEQLQQIIEARQRQ